jgi:hypothetical protein
LLGISVVSVSPNEATSAAAAKFPVVLSTVANVSGMASTAMSMPMPSAGSPIARKSGVSRMNAPRGIPGAKPRNTAAQAIMARLPTGSGIP